MYNGFNIIVSFIINLYIDEKTLHLRKILGIVIKRIREEQFQFSCNRLANEYGINDSNLGKIEKAEIDCKFVTAWRIAEALGMKLSDFVKIIEDELGQDFKLIDE